MKQWWSPQPRLWQAELEARDLLRPVIYPGATYQLVARVSSLLGQSAQLKLDTGAGGVLVGEVTPMTSASPSTWEWQEFKATFTLPAGATQALPRIYCSFCGVLWIEMKLLPTRYRVVEKHLTDEVTGQMASFG